ncbi:hypothetical protein [Planomonospora venezuelensis]|uniref:MYXO-CTERM domain-containing protein n=1 Tax=Planomonospora venezuelensis TaxID=1999 RepID=A0A841DEF0_PLAVE|nr:hypothetical protein [Planomonospora venezuelensis]MBB5966678.1 hypothetical protein [Planomonospora venezuelensis]GIN00351.1 hypothetical protein Pve01_20090 [Planomonospora venezuelensis]
MARRTGVLGRWIGAVAAAAAVAAGAASPAAALQDDVEVSPARVEPGGGVEITAHDCGGTAIAKSEAFQDDVELTGGSEGDPAGSAKVAAAAEPRSYVVEVECEGTGVTLYGSYEVVGDGGPDTGGGGLALAGGAAEHGTAAAADGPSGTAVAAWGAGCAALLAGTAGLALVRRRRAAGRG